MSSSIFVIKNQQGALFTKAQEWSECVNAKDFKDVVRFKHYDEALNTLIELSAKDIEVRGVITEGRLAETGVIEFKK